MTRQINAIMKMMGYTAPANNGINNLVGYLSGFIGGAGQFILNLDVPTGFWSRFIEGIITAAVCGFVGMAGKELFILVKRSFQSYFKKSNEKSHDRDVQKDRQG